MATKKKRHRRTPEEMIADLQAQIAELQQKKAARELKQSAAMKATIQSVRHIDKALKAAVDEDNRQLQFALADARKPLRVLLEQRGLELPKVQTPRGRRPESKNGQAKA